MLDTSGFELAGQFQQPSTPLVIRFLLSGTLQVEDQLVQSFPIAPPRTDTFRADQIANRHGVIPGFCESLT
jgi:hypothetical protein